MHVWLDDVLLRDPTLNAGEILMSESQERMMAVVTPEKLDEFLAITGKWDVETAVIGEVNDSGRLTIDHHGQRIVDVDPRTVAHEGPVYERPYARPAWQDGLQADTTVAAGLARPTSADDLRATALRLLASPNLASKAWVTNQYDRFVQGNTALAQPDDGGVVRVDEETGRGVALATDANGRYGKLDPRAGAQLALAEAYRNVATVGATPLAVTDCLNFGSPEHPDSMWQLVEAIEGLADACQELGVPVTGGNVSLYNGTGEPGQIDSSIHPTPVVGVLGVIDDVRTAVPSGWRAEGLSILLLGRTADELDGSAWAGVEHGHLGGLPPRVDLAAEKALASALVAAREQGLVAAAHDLSEGGLAQALLEASLRYGVGADVALDGVTGRDGVTPFAALFSESTARALVAVDPEHESELVAVAESAGVPVLRLGRTGGEELVVAGGFDGETFTVALDEAREAHEGTLPRIFG